MRESPGSFLVRESAGRVIERAGGRDATLRSRRGSSRRQRPASRSRDDRDRLGHRGRRDARRRPRCREPRCDRGRVPRGGRRAGSPRRPHRLHVHRLHDHQAAAADDARAGGDGRALRARDRPGAERPRRSRGRPHGHLGRHLDARHAGATGSTASRPPPTSRARRSPAGAARARCGWGTTARRARGRRARPRPRRRSSPRAGPRRSRRP